MGLIYVMGDSVVVCAHQLLSLGMRVGFLPVWSLHRYVRTIGWCTRQDVKTGELI